MAHDNQEKTTRERELEVENEQLKHTLEQYKVALADLQKQNFEQDLQLFQLHLDCGSIPVYESQRRVAQQELAKAIDDFRMKEAGYVVDIAYLQRSHDVGESKIHTVQTQGEFFKPQQEAKNGQKHEADDRPYNTRKMKKSRP